jgi:hypothetical protein
MTTAIIRDAANGSRKASGLLPSPAQQRPFRDYYATLIENPVKTLMKTSCFSHTFVALITLLVALNIPVPAAAAQSRATSRAIDASTYPREVVTAAGTILLHHPVITDWKNFEVLSGYSPLEVRLAGNDKAWLGTAAFEVETVIHYDQRLVSLDNPRTLKIHFPEGAPKQQLMELTRAAQGSGAQSVVLDFLIRALPDDFKIPGQDRSGASLNFDPPRIIVTRRPTRLLLIDGPPAMSAIARTGLKIVINTNWEIYHHEESDQWYLLDGGSWLTNSMLSGGDWRDVRQLPVDFSNLQYDSEWEHLQAVIPPRPPEEPPLPFAISYEPAELVQIRGKEQFEDIPETSIEVVTNTRYDLFRFENRYYILISGRWFTATDLNRNWSAVENLPGDFARIPRDHEKSYVRASVPGTREAKTALIEAALPRLVELDPAGADGVSVNYVGEPSFVPIEGTILRRAENTPYQVIAHNNFYYLCFEGGWYKSERPAGPWSIAYEVPEAIYTIPPTDPAYNVTFVRLNSFDDTSGKVAYSHTQSYRGSYSTGSSLVYGTGWYYPPYVNRYGYGYPYYWRHPYGYGHGAHYNPVYGGYYPVSTSHTFDKPTQNKDWEWGLDGSKKQVTGASRKNYIGSGTYSASAAGNGSQSREAYSGTRSELASQNNGSDDLYSGSDGNVYRRTPQGWQRHENGTWKTLGGDAQRYLEQQYEARDTGYRNYAVQQRQWDWPGENKN